MKSPAISLEFFPPRSDVQRAQLWTTIEELSSYNPAYLSMTWGALGTDSQASIDILEALCSKCSIPVVAHLSCAAVTQKVMIETIERLEKLGIQRFLALRGDRVAKNAADTTANDHTAGSNTANSHTQSSGEVLTNAGAGRESEQPSSMQYASELVELLSQRGHSNIMVAAYPEHHPESPSPEDDLRWLKHKLNKGAHSAITQFFFDPAVFLRFRDKAQAHGIAQPLVPGILPINNIQKVTQFAQKCGASVPSELVRKFEQATNPEDRRELAIEHTVKLCSQLMKEGVDAFHFYTLNQSTLTKAVLDELLGDDSASLHPHPKPAGSVGAAA